ncbi:MAG: IS21 family transposase [Deltaproteobacteria bacterium]|nr:IS21 family transposase [Deltaproteobacteria bacterium]
MSAQDPAMQMAEVLRLSLVEGCSIRSIAEQLSISRKRVRKILGRVSIEPKLAPSARPSLLDPYDLKIRGWIEESPDLRTPAVLERLRPLGYTGGVSILRDRLRQLRPRRAHEAFLELDFKPGGAIQVDWADFGFALPGCPRRVSAFVAVLAYSRLIYIEFTLSQKIGSLLRCMERAYAFFGGTTLVDIFDNMKTVVIAGSGATAQFNPTFVEYAKIRGFAIVACNRRSGHEKGRVERPIGFVRTRFWPGRRFSDLLDLNRQATAWREDFANHRVHEVTGKVPSLVHQHEERALLKPLSAAVAETDDIESVPVTKTCRLSFDRNRYSIPGVSFARAWLSAPMTTTSPSGWAESKLPCILALGRSVRRSFIPLTSRRSARGRGSPRATCRPHWPGSAKRALGTSSCWPPTVDHFSEKPSASSSCPSSSESQKRPLRWRTS